MRSHFLAIDFGTTSTKSALLDLEDGAFVGLERRSDGGPALAGSGRGGIQRHELSLPQLLQRFDDICHRAWEITHFDGIVLCSEMHGFVVVSEMGEPQTNYVSWLDARSTEQIDGISTHDLIVEELGDDFRRLTGMRPRPGFPLLNLAHTGRTGELTTDGWALSLPCALARLTHDGMREEAIFEHPTMLAAMALADVEAQATPAPRLLDLVHEIGQCRIRVGAPSGEGQIAGHWRSREGLIPIYAGVGDHQCSVLGASPEPKMDANLNLGTGSQVGIVDGPLDDAFELRPYFDSRHLTAITHIPAGRALNEFVGFLEAIARFAGATGDFWGALATVTPEQVQDAALAVDLSIFEGARGWTDGGSIRQIVEGSLDVEAYLAAVLAAFTRQYVDVLAEVDAPRQLQRLLLSGGIARRLPQLRHILAKAMPYDVQPAADLDESLLGLRCLALHAAGRAASVCDAAEIFQRQCVLRDEPIA